MRKLIFILPILISVFILSSCNNDDSYSLGKFWITSGTVSLIGEDEDYYYVTADNGEVLFPSATNIHPKYLEDGMRVIVNFTKLGDADEDDYYDYYVKVNDMTSILTKPIFNFTEETTETVKDSIGNDPVTILDAWFTNDFLNVEFKYGGGNRVHYINLVQDLSLIHI